MRSPSLALVARLAVAAGLTLLVFWRSDPSAVVRAAVGADLRYIAIAVLLVLVDRTLMAYRWLVLLGPIAHASRPRAGVVMRIFFVSTFVGSFLPASIGGDAVRAYSLARHNVPAATSIASVFMDRILGVLSLLLMAVAGLGLARDLATDPIVLVALSVTLGACVAALALVFSAHVASVGRRLCERLPAGRVHRGAGHLIDAVQRYATSHGDLLNVLAASLAVQVLRVAQGYCLGLSLGIAAPLGAYFAFIPLILLVMLLPVTINGIGTSQAAFVWFFARAAVARPDAFALSVLFVALGIVGNLPGGFLYLTQGFSSYRGRSLRT